MRVDSHWTAVTVGIESVKLQHTANHAVSAMAELSVVILVPAV